MLLYRIQDLCLHLLGYIYILSHICLATRHRALGGLRAGLGVHGDDKQGRGHAEQDLQVVRRDLGISIALEEIGLSRVAPWR